MQRKCSATGRTFSVTDQELALRKKLGIDGEPLLHPLIRWQILGAFWQHWALHKRKCDRTGKQIISVFSEDCPYPIWHKDEWLKHADPPRSNPDITNPIFPQMWELFRRCPIAHSMGANNENCEYTDDWWYSKNCYLSHSGHGCEDLRYCYRDVSLRNCQYCVFSFDSERCVDLVFSHHCFRSQYLFLCWQCSESAFLYDCRNCSNCMFCSNLRNKSYCFGNRQLTKEEYLRATAEWNLRSRQVYVRAKQAYADMLRTSAWHRALHNDLCEGCDGNFLYECKDAHNCFLVTNKCEGCMNVTRSGVDIKDVLDCISVLGTQLAFYSCCAQDQCYDIKFGYNVIQCKFMEYCAQCFQCQHCFGCCGLVGKKYHLFNTPYEPDEYERRKADVIAAMKRSGEYGQYFPGHFAATPYEESLSGFYWPLSTAEGRKLGFRMSNEKPERVMDALDATQVPDRSDAADADLPKKVFWDTNAKRPFQVADVDIAFAHDLGCPLPYTYYMVRLQENFRLVPFTGELRTVACAACKIQTPTSWPSTLDTRILCEGCYLKSVY